MAERVTRRLRQQVFQRAKGCCEYCRSQALYTTEAFEVEHILPTIRNGPTTLENLALACSACNGHKYDKIEAIDPLTQQAVPLFHPRRDVWSEHFAWSHDTTQVLGQTPTGRATAALLHMNSPNLINWRRVMRLARQHPPEEAAD
jgi:hypothetical protein